MCHVQDDTFSPILTNLAPCRVELEAKMQGKDIFHEDWCALPFV